ncbi:MAG TPA: hypothetical protein VM487_18085 [Phycisphaerae bacterium]|nr:hypothetical protein [Phycisphaerae bacterium]
MTTETHKAIPEAAEETKILYNRLKELAIDEVISYDALNQLIGRNVQNEARGYLQTARTWLRDRDSILVECVRTVGMKRLDGSGIIATAEHGLRGVRRAAGRVAKKTICADYKRLDDEGKVRHNVALSVAGAIRMMTGASGQKKLVAAVDSFQDRLPPRKLLDVFRNGVEKPK